MKLKQQKLLFIIIFCSFSSLFAQIDTVSVNLTPINGGNIIGGGEYPTGSEVILEAKPNYGFQFISWTENGLVVSNDSLYKFISVGNRNLTANFQLNSYMIGTNSLPTEGGTTSGGGLFLHGSNVTLSAISNIGYSFSNWTENEAIISFDSTFSFTALQNRSVDANFLLKTYEIKTNQFPLDGGTVVGSGIYNHGDSVILIGIPAEGYNFVSWTENGVIISADSSLTFIADRTRELTANFSLNNYEIKTSSNPIVGGTTNGGGIFNHGDSVHIDAIPASGYVFGHWTENDSIVSLDSNYSFIASGDRDLVAVFAIKQFSITTSVYPTLSGVSSGDGNYSNLSLATVSATPSPGWIFESWSENGNIIAADTNYSFIVLANRTLQANFTKKIYYFSANSSIEEGGLALGTGFYTHDSIVIASAIPNQGYNFVGWTENDSLVSSDSLYSFKITKNRNLIANFEKQVYLVNTEPYPRNAGLTMGDSTYTFGDTVKVTAISNANLGWEFVSWNNGDEIVSFDSVSIFISETNINLIAVFKLKNYNVDLSSYPENAGTVEGIGTYTHGDSVTITAIPDIGWFFANWSDGQNNVSNNPEFTFSIDKHKNLIANFAHELYSINSSPEPAEAGYVSGSGTFYYGQSAILTPIANPGWEFISWTEDDKVVSTDSLYSINVENNRILKANFKLIDYSVNCLANPIEGGITLGCGISRYNSEMETIASPNDGWEFINWTENGEIVSTELNYQFNVKENRNLVANFQLATSINVLDDHSYIPDEYYLSNAYPNPFNPETKINFGLPESSTVKVMISSITGEIIQTVLDNVSLPAGNYSNNFEANDLSSGIYLYIILAKSEKDNKSFKKVQKLILLK